MRYIFILVLAIVTVWVGFVHNTKATTHVEHYAPAPLTIIGQARRVRVNPLLRTVASIVPVYKQPPTWIVNVPLTPFRAPLRLLDPIPLPPFLLHKTYADTQAQGDCGSCFVFAVAHMIADRLSIQDNVSVQQIMSCFDTNACDGGSPEDLCMWIAQTGTTFNTERAIPYKQKRGGKVTTECVIQPGVRVGILPNSVRSLVQYVEEEGYDPAVVQSNVLNMKRALTNEGPFYCAMTVYDDLFTYSGLKPYVPGKNASQVGGHAIEVVGFCEAGVDTRPAFKDAYWICRNSWGKTWPTRAALAGFFTVPMGKNVCGIESRCGSATPFIEGTRVATSVTDPRQTEWVST